MEPCVYRQRHYLWLFLLVFIIEAFGGDADLLAEMQQFADVIDE